MKRPDDAVAMTKLIVHWTPQHGVAWEALGRVLRRVGRSAEAIEAFQAQFPFYIERYALYNSIAECYLDLKQQDEAVKAAHLSLEINPNNVLALGAIGAAYTAQGRYEEAIEVYRRQLVHDSRRIAFALYNIGLCLQRLQRHQESLTYFQQHLKLNPGDVLALLQIGTQYWYLQDYNQSVATYKEALRLDPNHGQAAFFIADTLAAMGKHQEACQYYEVHEKNSPNDSNAHLGWAESLAAILHRKLQDPDPKEDELLELERLITHHRQRSLGVAIDAAMPLLGGYPAVVSDSRRNAAHRIKRDAVWLCQEPPWPHHIAPWSAARHLELASIPFRRQTKLLLLIIQRFSSERRIIFPKDLTLHIVALVSEEIVPDAFCLAQLIERPLPELLSTVCVKEYTGEQEEWKEYSWACQVIDCS